MIASSKYRKEQPRRAVGTRIESRPQPGASGLLGQGECSDRDRPTVCPGPSAGPLILRTLQFDRPLIVHFAAIRVPSPIGPSVSLVIARTFGFHLNSFRVSTAKSKTSSIGRLIRVVLRISAMSSSIAGGPDGARTRPMARTHKGIESQARLPAMSACPHDGGNADGQTGQRHYGCAQHRGRDQPGGAGHAGAARARQPGAADARWPGAARGSEHGADRHRTNARQQAGHRQHAPGPPRSRTPRRLRCSRTWSDRCWRLRKRKTTQVIHDQQRVLSGMPA